ncbi:MAG: 1,4-beta-xylanase [Flavitalea sp.]
MKFLRLLAVAAICTTMQFCGSPEEKTTETSKPDSTSTSTGRAIWTKEKANEWYATQPWLVGCNFITSNAINQLEMFQAESFDTATIDKELGWAASIGMNTVRVYLQDLLWTTDSTGFVSRLNTFLAIAKKHNIRPLFVLFDSCWDPFPKTGKQRDPQPHVHNSGWVQSPGLEILKDTSKQGPLEGYVKGVVGAFAKDDRVLGWDVWNEPDNPNASAYGKVELPEKPNYVLPLLKKAFAWARAANPSQPLTSGVWKGNWSNADSLTPIEKTQIEESDVISFHNYENAAEFQKRIDWLTPYGRPLLCTEYMARGNGSFFKTTLPLAKKYKIAAYNWGLVDGKTQTKYAWDSWNKKYTASPKLWFHEIFQKDGKPYDKAETDLIRSLTAASGSKPADSTSTKL